MISDSFNVFTAVGIGKKVFIRCDGCSISANYLFSNEVIVNRNWANGPLYFNVCRVTVQSIRLLNPWKPCLAKLLQMFFPIHLVHGAVTQWCCLVGGWAKHIRSGWLIQFIIGSIGRAIRTSQQRLLASNEIPCFSLVCSAGCGMSYLVQV